jgi:hypothetical protein
VSEARGGLGPRRSADFYGAELSYYGLTGQWDRLVANACAAAWVQ